MRISETLDNWAYGRPRQFLLTFPDCAFLHWSNFFRTKLFCCRNLQLSLIVRMQPGLRAPPDRGTRDTILGGNAFFGEHWR